MVRNPGRSAARIGIVDLNHPGMKVRIPQQLLPGDVGWITVTWDTRLGQGDTKAEVLLRLDEAESVVVSLTVKVIPPIDILPQPAVFISGFRDEGVTRILEIVNNDPAPLNIVGICAGERRFRAGALQGQDVFLGALLAAHRTCILAADRRASYGI
jgi:hypothetical protein